MSGRSYKWSCAGAMVAMAASAAVAAPIELCAMYGINRTTGQLVRYDFATNTHGAVGYVRKGNGPAITDIDAMALIPGFQNLFTFHTDSSDHKLKLSFVDCETAKATVMFGDLEGGRITGATAAQGVDGLWHVYAVQRAKLPDPFTVSGSVNLNPNNKPDYEFEVIKPDGSSFSRDQLHSTAAVDGTGTYYFGDATTVRFRPKGNGNQNSLIIAGEPYPLQNSNTYILRGEMSIKVYNDQIKNGKAMGHWWLQIVSGTATFGDQLDVEIPDRLVSVDHKNGVVTEIMTLTRGYDGLATADGLTFYATSEDKLYRLDATAFTESVIGTMSHHDVLGLEMCDQSLVGFEVADDRLMLIDLQTGQRLGIPASIGVADLGTITFVPLPADPINVPEAYD